MKEFKPTQSVNDSITQIAALAHTNHPLSEEAMACLQKLYTLSLCPISNETNTTIIGLNDDLFMRYTHIMQVIMQERSTPATSNTLKDIQQALLQGINPVSLFKKIAHTALLFSRRQIPALSPSIERFSQQLSLSPPHEKSD